MRCDICKSKTETSFRDYPCPCMTCHNMTFVNNYNLCNCLTLNSCWSGNDYKEYILDWVKAIRYKDYIYKRRSNVG